MYEQTCQKCAFYTEKYNEVKACKVDDASLNEECESESEGDTEGESTENEFESDSEEEMETAGYIGDNEDEQ